MNFILIAAEFLAFTVMVALISWWKTRKDNLGTQDGYYLAGHNLVGMVIAGSLLMSNLSAEQFVGHNGQSARVGMSTIGWEVTSAIALTFLAFVLMPRYLKTGLITIPEFFEQRYDAATRHLVSVIVLFSYVVIMLPNILYAGAQVFSQLFDIEELFGLDRFWCLAILSALIAVVGACYSQFGGLHAVALSDSINGIGVLIGGLMIPIFALDRLGGGSIREGMQRFLEMDPVRLNVWNPATLNEPYLPWPLLLTGMVINNLYYWSTNQAIVQRTFGAKSLEAAQKGAVAASFLKLLTPLLIVIPGILAYDLYGEQVWQQNGDVAYPMLVHDVLPKSLLGFFAAVMFGAILSSFNSVLNSATTIFSLDIYRSIFKKNASDADCVRMGRRFGWVLTLFAIVLAPFMLYMGGITSFVNSAFAAFNTPIFVCLAVGFLSMKADALLPKIVIPVHVVLYCFLQFFARSHFAFLANVHYLYFTTILFLIDMIIVALVLKFHPRQYDYMLEDHSAVDLTPWKAGRVVAGIALVLMVLAYLIFSPLGVAERGYVTYEVMQNTVSAIVV